MKDSILAIMQKDHWMMEPNHLNALIRQVADFNVNPMMALGGSKKNKRAMRIENSVAVIPVIGVLMDEIPWWYEVFGIAATSYRQITADIRQALDSDAVESILLQVDSPGGSVAGVQGAADAIYGVRGKKPIAANVGALCCSGAYYLASQTGTITAEKNAEVGSIGAYLVLVDYSAMAEKDGIKVTVVKSGEHKGVGVTGAKITDEQIKPLQEVIDGMAEHFIEAVVRGRGMKKTAVEALATGRVWLAPEAVKNGLIDGIGNFENAMAVSAGQDKSLNISGDDVMADSKTTPTNTEELEKVKKEARDAAVAEEQKRVGDIKAAFPDDPGFALEQITANASVEQAKIAYNAVLSQRLTEANAKIAELEKSQSNDAKGKQEPSKASENKGSDGVPFTQKGNEEKPKDFASLVEAKMKEKNIAYVEAAKLVRKENPDLQW